MLERDEDNEEGYCTKCEELNEKGRCISMEETNCETELKGQCLYCKNGYHKDTTTCKDNSELEEEVNQNCEHYRGTMKRCDECNDGYVLTKERYCYLKPSENEQDDQNSEEDETTQSETKEEIESESTEEPKIKRS